MFDVAGILACSAYIDLNPVRAGIAKTLEDSDHTSIQDRIHQKTKKVPSRCKDWPKVPLLSLADATEKSVTLEQYLKLVDETGRLIRDGKSSLSAEMAPILAKLNIEPTEWVKTTEQFRNNFKRVVGCPELIKDAAEKANKFWFQGIRAASKVFGGQVARRAT